MEKKNNEKLTMLQYSLKRYQAMRNGAMCQSINNQISKLIA